MNRHNVEPTPILDYGSPAVCRFAETIRPTDESATGFLRAAHEAISSRIHPVYTVKERQPMSMTIDKARGSCSQRLACLEGLARSRGIGTRVRALWVSGRFWNNRFPLARLFIPNRVLLAWPQFAIDSGWCGVEEIHGSLEQRLPGAVPFANDGETLFEAVQSTAVDFEGKTRTCSTICDLSEFVMERGAIFDARDDLFDRLGSFEDTWKGKVFEVLYANRRSA
jgi:hypothetical protein